MLVIQLGVNLAIIIVCKFGLAIVIDTQQGSRKSEYDMQERR
jgi:hypothetical protein